MYRAFFLFFIFSSLNAQSSFFNDPVVSGTPLIPPDSLILKYLDELKKNDYAAFNKITAVSVLPQNVGDEYDFNVLNLTNPSSPKLEEKRFVLKVVSEKVDIWVEKTELENNHVTDGVIAAIYSGLMLNTPASGINPQQGIFEIESDIYGSAPDIDGNGRVEFLLTDIKDGWEESGSFIGGFFYPNDQISSFPGSNVADILYVDTYPGIFQNNRYDTYRPLGTVAHELQHLIHYNYDKNESSWVNEGLSELASYLCGYGLRSPGLYLENTSRSMISWNDQESLSHYSRVALWTYFLYEKYGLSLIRAISQAPLSGISGFNQALQNAGLNIQFPDVLSVFFKTLCANDPLQTPGYAFDYTLLQYLKVVPKYRIREFPDEREFTVGAYALELVEFTNGDSLQIVFNDPFKYPVYINKLGFGTRSLLNESASDITDNDFGSAHHTQGMYLVNVSGSSDIVRYRAESRTKYDIVELKYDSNSLTNTISAFNSSLKGTTNAIQYSSPRDTAILKSVSFYNKSALTDLRIHLYQSPLANGRNPASVSFVEKNVASNGWVIIDTEDLQLRRNSNQTFDVGIEFLTDAAGAMGYQKLTGSVHTNRSFVKGYSSQNFFYYLNQYSISNIPLDGTWMIRLELAVPYSGPKTGKKSRIESVTLYPLPYSPQTGQPCTVQYELDAPGPVHLRIFNILGQLVWADYDPQGSGMFLWQGKNLSGQMLASGLYIARLTTKRNEESRRLVLIR